MSSPAGIPKLVAMTGDTPEPRTHAAVPALTGPAVAGITRLSAVDTVRARIALAVELGLLAPGEQLPSDADVAAALDVSEITARRAVKSLAEEGLLRRVRGRSGGTFVADDAPAAAGRAGGAVQAYRADAEAVHRLIDQRLLAETSLTHFAAVAAGAEAGAGAVAAALDESLDPLRPDTGIEQVAAHLATYNLVAAPVVDDEGRLLGAVTVDDLLDHMLPANWRDSALRPGGDVPTGRSRPGGRA